MRRVLARCSPWSELVQLRGRVQELLERGNQLLQEARDARTETRRVRIESDAHWSRCLQLEAMLRRLDVARSGGSERGSHED